MIFPSLVAGRRKPVSRSGLTTRPPRQSPPVTKFLGVTLLVVITSGMAVWLFQGNNELTVGASGTTGDAAGQNLTGKATQRACARPTPRRAWRRCIPQAGPARAADPVDPGRGAGQDDRAMVQRTPG